MLFIYLHIESVKLIKLNAADTDKNTILDQTLLIKKGTWDIASNIKAVCDIRAHIGFPKASIT